MMRQPWSIAVWGFLVLTFAASANGQGAFDGRWRTSFGIVELEQSGGDVTGSYGNNGQFTLEGTIEGDKLTFEYVEGETKGDAHWTLDDTGHAFAGRFRIRGGRGGTWQGWRPDPDSRGGERADFSGLWLTNLGLMKLEQDGDKIIGEYAVRGASDIEGTVIGRRLDFKVESFRDGKGWFDMAAGGETLVGAASTNGFAAWYGWSGRRAPEFARHVGLVAGKILEGSTDGLLTYSVRAPDGYQADAERKWPAVVILHGSNMNGRAYVNTIAATWPEVAREYLLIGINGERPSATGDSPAFNYSYVNYTGRSTFKGYPGTDRESPALVAEALDEFREVYPISRYFVGGHSQGGYLTYSLLMNFPDKIDGAFPVSAGLIVQCEPDAYDDQELRAAQRKVPLVIVHGNNDPVVGFASAQHAAVQFGEAGWPAFRFLADETGAGHMFARLPVDKAIRWLESHTTDDPAELIRFATERSREDGGNRDAVAALRRLERLSADSFTADVRLRIDRLAGIVHDQAAAGAESLLPKVTSNENNEWIDEFLAYRDEFEFASAAREVMQAFRSIRAEHEEPAKKLYVEARTAFRRGRQEEGYAKYREIVERYYAASSYRNVRRWLDRRE